MEGLKQPKIPLLEQLTYTEYEGSLYVDLKQIISFLQNNKKLNEPDIFPSNILKDFAKCKSGIKNLDEKRCVLVNSFIRFTAKNYDKYEICERIINDVVDNLFNIESDKKSLSLLYIYKEVAKFEATAWSDDILSSSEVIYSHTLYFDYERHFKPLQWKKICLFEYHFSKNHNTDLEFELGLKARIKYLEHLKAVHTLSLNLSNKCDDVVSENNLRKEASEKINGINFVSNDVKHSFTSIEESLNSYISDFAKETTAVVLKCNKLCHPHGDIHLFVETSAKENLDYICSLLRIELEKKHGLFCAEVFFLEPGCLQEFKGDHFEQSGTQRFKLQLALLNKKLNENIKCSKRCVLTEIEPCETIYVDCGNQILCKSCFLEKASVIDNRLDWRSINVKKEWLHAVPYEIQELFTTLFINIVTLDKSMDKKLFLCKKIPKLYCLFDTALNIRNRTYTGIIQQLNTQELAINYHSLSKIFEITSKSGITQSLRTADRWLKEASGPNRNYFETYIKQYTLKYQSCTELAPSTHRVNLQDCFNIFYIDNLVRLSVHEDPDQGKSRTSQLCTLPITLKGLPKDSSVVRSWHDNECDEECPENECACMDSIILGKEDVSLLTKPTVDEKEAWRKFQAQISWTASFLSETGLFTLNENEQETVETNNDQPKLNSSVDKTHDQREDILLEVENLENQLNESLNLDVSLEKAITVEDMHIPNASDSDDLPTSIPEDTDLTDSDYFLKEFSVPPLLCRHPVPATGRDDDIVNLKEVLEETLHNLGRSPNEKHRILFAPDHKISKNLLQLMKNNSTFLAFLPEFPVLHLRKSKIVNLFAAYKTAGLLHMFKYMKDAEQEDDWMKLITLQNIETASKNIARLSLALHSALLYAFSFQMSFEEKCEFIEDITAGEISELNEKWNKRLTDFIECGITKNATFALHFDIMTHCDEIVAISTAERVGGPDGYALLLAAIKKSLPFAFMNGASSYASFCVELLCIHYGAGTFHKNMKMSLFSTPHKGSTTNLALDTQMDHKDAVKAFRPRSTVESIVPRMAVIDHLNDIQEARQSIIDIRIKGTDESGVQRGKFETIQVPISRNDMKFALPLSNLLIRQRAFCTDDELIPFNIYDSNKKSLPLEILDQNSFEIGEYLILKYSCQQGLFGLSEKDLQDISAAHGPSKLKKRAKEGKGVTMRRLSTIQTPTYNKNKEEIKRKAYVKKQSRVLDCMSSSMNTCQSLVNPDGTKPNVQKSAGIKKALSKLFDSIFESSKKDNVMNENRFLFSGEKEIAKETELREEITIGTIEFAGVKFKTKAVSGQQYLKYIENGIIRNLKFNFPQLRHIAICEEKYTFTPDDFKSATREKRHEVKETSIAHLKCSDEVISDHVLSHSATRNTSEGRKLISNYLARNIHNLELQTHLEIIVDSELIMKYCDCSGACNCQQYTHPIAALFGANGFEKRIVLTDIKQRKGEAELAQVDWLGTLAAKLNEGEGIVSVVTSGDIDSIIVHLFAISIHWERNTDDSFKFPVYVYLQKAIPELYNITHMIEVIEKYFKFKYAAVSVAIICCMGGNDFLPKLHSLSHEKWITTFLNTPDAIQNIISFTQVETGKPTKAHLNAGVYKGILKRMFCPTFLNENMLSNEEVRQLSIKVPGRDFRHPTLWMPQDEAITCMAELVQCQIEYLFTTWDHSSTLPQFLGRGCLKRDDSGRVSFDFGVSSRTETKEDLLLIDEGLLRQKMNEARRISKRRNTFTPRKDDRRKRKPNMSTPKKMRRRNSQKQLDLLNQTVEKELNVDIEGSVSEEV